MRRNKSQTAKRRSHHALAAKRTATCECGALRAPHRACSNCGKYNGNIIVDVVARAKRDQRRTKRKELELRQSGQVTESKEKEEAKA